MIQISSTVDIEFKQIKVVLYSDNQKTAEKEDDIKAIWSAFDVVKKQIALSVSY